MQTFGYFPAFVGVSVRIDKCEITLPQFRWGVQRDLPSVAYRASLHISTPPGKSSKWADIPGEIVRAKSIPRAYIWRVIGRLGVAQKAIFSRFEMAMVYPLYAKL